MKVRFWPKKQLIFCKKILPKHLENKLSKLGAKLLIKTLKEWIILKEMPKGAQRLIYPQRQDNSKATYTKILTRDDGKIIWDKNARELERQIKAFYPWPSSFTFFKAGSDPNQKLMSLKILKARVAALPNEQNELGKTFLTERGELAVQTGKDCLIIEELQLEGSKPMTASNFLNGHQEIIGTILQ